MAKKKADDPVVAVFDEAARVREETSADSERSTYKLVPGQGADGHSVEQTRGELR